MSNIVSFLAFDEDFSVFLYCFIYYIFQLPTIGGIMKKKMQYNPQLIATAYDEVAEKGVSVYKKKSSTDVWHTREYTT